MCGVRLIAYGFLKRKRRDSEESMATWTDVGVPRNSYRFPDRCANCLRPNPEVSLPLKSDQSHLKGYYFVVTMHEYLRVEVPFCKGCADRQVRWERIGAVALGTAFVGGVGIGIWLGWLAGLLGVLLGVPAYWLLYYRGWAVRVPWYGKNTVGLSFKRPQYAQEFVLLNGLVEIALCDGKLGYVPKQRPG